MIRIKNVFQLNFSLLKIKINLLLFLFTFTTSGDRWNLVCWTKILFAACRKIKKKLTPLKYQMDIVTARSDCEWCRFAWRIFSKPKNCDCMVCCCFSLCSSFAPCILTAHQHTRTHHLSYTLTAEWEKEHWIIFACI